MAKKVTLHKQKILDDWSVMIEGAQGREQEIYQWAAWFIQQSQVPGVRIEMIKVKAAPALTGGLLPIGKEREYLMISHESLKDYRMYINARNYGNNLDVSWYLTCEPRFLKRYFSALLTKESSVTALSFALNLFEQQDLRAYVTVIHHSLLKAVEGLMTRLGQDASRMDRKSRGFLGIS
jgi:hypothetical protein